MDVFGDLLLSSRIALELTPGFEPLVGDAFDLFLADDIIDLRVMLSAPVRPRGLFDFEILPTQQGREVLRAFVRNAVPEPPAGPLVALIGCILLGARTWSFTRRT